MTIKSGVLSGIRVLDFGRFIAGPFCGALLADHGADVIRIDKIGGSEDRFILRLCESGEGPVFLQANRGKRSICLEPNSLDGREVVRRLVAQSDIVIANLPVSTLESMGLDYPTLSAVNPRIILVATNAFGRKGPAANKVGFNGVAEAMSGTVYLSGDPGRPRRAAGPFVDYCTAISAAFGAMLALMARERTGRGQEVSGSLMASALTISNSMLIEQAVTKPNRIPQGNRGYSSAPQDLFECSDGKWVILQVVGNPIWKKFCKMIEAEEWIQDARFRDDDSRGENASIVSERVSAWCAKRSREEVLRSCEEARVPAGPVHSPQEALDDAHIRASGVLRELAFPGMAEPAPVVDTIVQLSETPGRVRGRAPLPGEHTAEILAEIGYRPEEIARLQAERVV